MALVALSHMADDINQSFLPAVLPLLIATYHFSLQAAGTLVLAQAITSSVIQPAIGYLADTHSMPWLIGAGMFLAGAGIAAIGFTDSYTLMFVASLVSGIGVAMFHPEAARFANYLAGTRKGSGMRWFTVGGNLGFAVGPAYATLALALFAIHGTWLSAAPCLIMGVLLFVELPRLRSFQPAPRTQKDREDAPDRWVAFGILSLLTCVRAAVYVGIIAFIPLFFIGVLHSSSAVGNFGLTLYLLSGAFGTIAGGALQDRFGRKIVIFYSVFATSILLALFAVGAHTIFVGYLIIALTGFTIVASNTAVIVLGQEYLPNFLGIASGVTLGIGVSFGGMASPVLGAIGDRYGLAAIFYAASALAVVATVFTLFLLPERGRRPGPPRALARA